MKIVVLIIVFLAIHSGSAENYLLNGGQNSTINYNLVQKIEPAEGILSIDLTFVIPQSFHSSTYNQDITNFDIQFGLQPNNKKEWQDSHGNSIVKYSWTSALSPFDARISFNAHNRVVLEPVSTQAPFPLVNLSDNLKTYVKSTKLVPANNASINQLSKKITNGSKTQFDAVQKILSWIIDHMQYVLKPEEYGALYSLNSGKGNCQNYSHLAAALMRSVSIPVRIINGVTLKQPYDIKLGNQTMTLNMAEGRHSWIEVYFPDLGWMPFDPQQSELFVSNRFIRIEIGIDNEETVNDGLVHWTRAKGSNALLSFQEIIESSFVEDNVNLNGEKLSYGPRKLLLLPSVKANFVPLKTPEIKPEKQFVPADYLKMKFTEPFMFGNIDFPKGVNFIFVRELADGKESNSRQLKKNFLVETAEYVTSKLQYGQIFILDSPVKLQKIGLALQKFGGTGSLWLELHEDKNGIPGSIAASSKAINLKELSSKPGYYWVDFDFTNEELLLTPDKYWITLGFSGGPIVNWFYSYGKPIGPIDGTRYKLFSETEWSKTLGYEFNYRVIGNTIK